MIQYQRSQSAVQDSMTRRNYESQQILASRGLSGISAFYSANSTEASKRGFTFISDRLLQIMQYFSKPSGFTSNPTILTPEEFEKNFSSLNGSLQMLQCFGFKTNTNRSTTTTSTSSSSSAPSSASSSLTFVHNDLQLQRDLAMINRIQDFAKTPRYDQRNSGVFSYELAQELMSMF
jgi:hypothetical protein